MAFAVILGAVKLYDVLHCIENRGLSTIAIYDVRDFSLLI